MGDAEIKFALKGWDFEKRIVNCEEYCGKLLYLDSDSYRIEGGD